MRLLILLSVLIATPAFAITDAAMDYCLAQPSPRDCLSVISATERAAQQEAYNQRAQNQMDLLREQSRGMALFGAGAAMINGMNQGFNQMHLPPPSVQFAPMVLPPLHTH